jgi:hypothetical protein
MINTALSHRVTKRSPRSVAITYPPVGKGQDAVGGFF